MKPKACRRRRVPPHLHHDTANGCVQKGLFRCAVRSTLRAVRLVPG